jgi:hypothetical protein
LLDDQHINWFGQFGGIGKINQRTTNKKQGQKHTHKKKKEKEFHQT